MFLEIFKIPLCSFTECPLIFRPFLCPPSVLENISFHPVVEYSHE